MILPLAACGFSDHGFLAATGPIAQAQRDHFFSIIGWTLVVIVPLFIATPIVLWKYRLGQTKAPYRPNWAFSRVLESLIWGLPVVIVAILGWNLWQASHRLDPYKPIPGEQPPLDIQVVSLDWKWLFIYPDDGIARVNELVIPVNRPISFKLTSQTVMQSFLIPRLGGQIYTMPGMTTRLHLLASEPGRYRGQNTQYNGKGFAKQKFAVHAVDETEFRQWLDRQKSAPALDMNAYLELAERSVIAKPKSFGEVCDQLFEQILTQARNQPSSVLPSAASGG